MRFVLSGGFRWLSLLALLGFVACDEPGDSTTTGTTGTSGTETATGGNGSYFGSFFGGSAGDRADNTATAASPEAPCDPGSDCPPSPTPGDKPLYEPPVCAQPLAAATGATAVCRSFCEVIGGCIEASAQDVGFCTDDCIAGVGGIRLEALQGIFGCYQQASCDALLNLGDMDDGEDIATPDTGTNTAEEDSPPPPPTPGGSAEGGKADGPLSAGEVRSCVQNLLEGWSQSTANDGNLGQCVAMVEAFDACDGTDSATVSTPGEPAEPASTEPPPPPSGDPGGDSEEEGDAPGDEEEDVGVLICRMAAAMFDSAFEQRSQACAALDCEAQDDCLEQLRVCTPMVELITARSDSGSATSSTGSGEVPPSVPTDPPSVPEPDDPPPTP